MEFSFLERYFNDLQRVINIEQLKDDTLNKKVEEDKRRKLYSYVYRYPTEVEKE